MKSITEYLDATAAKFPDKTAFADDHSQLTFCELRNSARSIATAISRQGLFKKPILIMLARGPKCVASFLGAAYSGNFYTPLDTNMPPERVQKIIDELSPAVIITESHHNDLLGALHYDAVVCYYEDLLHESPDDALLADVERRQIDTDLLYVMFTSGSTGNPKGVCICHRSIIDYIEQLVTVYPLNESTIWGNQSELYFDKTIKELYASIKLGFTVIFIPKQAFSFPVKLIEYLNEKQINTIDWVPSLYNFVAVRRVLVKLQPRCLRVIAFSGEVMHNKILNAWRAYVPDAVYINVYGPTEITGTCSYYVVDREFADDEPLPIGKHYLNTDILLLNENNAVASPGEIGEICVRGTSLACGYYNNFAKTAEAFVQNPLNAAYPELIYRTGDLARYNERGELLYAGRNDFQIKHMGYRIELGEIETAAGSISGVDICACVYDNEKQRIVLFYCGTAQSKSLADALKTKLQSYMVPGVVTKLETMPLNANGKTDRQKLKELMG
jgi:amino acid adenylation domain-containing protein